MSDSCPECQAASGCLAAIIVIAWMAGFILAKGFWLSLLAMFFPPYAVLLVVFRLMMTCGLIE